MYKDLSYVVKRMLFYRVLLEKGYALHINDFPPRGKCLEICSNGSWESWVGRVYLDYFSDEEQPPHTEFWFYKSEKIAEFRGIIEIIEKIKINK